VHINNSNPALLPHSPERLQAQAAGWRIPLPGEELTL
jgi:pyrroloquinoline quinone biosynthesis protein B